MLEVRQRLGDFEVIRLLGKGGMGEVYEALQLNPPRPVALKVLKGWLAEDDEALQRFWREAAVPARLDHPGIVRIIATGKTDDGIAYYAMQLVRGLTLSQLMQKASEAARARTVPQNYSGEHATPPDPSTGDNLFLPPASADAAGEDAPPEVLQQYQADRFGVVVRVGIQAARALASAHKQGVLHRDVKPSNLMIDHHDQLYVVDFGLTRALLGDGLSTRPGTVCGTPWYMSPEQASGEAVDGRSDLFSLGVTLYELAAGGAGPYSADRCDNTAVLREVRAGNVLPLSSVAPGVPVELERIIHRLLRTKPRRRYQTAEELIADLERLSRQPEMQSGGRRERRQKHWAVYGGAGLVAIAGLVVLLVLALRSPTPPPAGEPPPQTVVKTPASTDTWPPLPPERVERKPNMQMPLLTLVGNPIWSARIAGLGKTIPDPILKMNLLSRPGQQITLLALDNDPQRNWFDLKVRMRAMPVMVLTPPQAASLVSLLGPPQPTSFFPTGPLASAIMPDTLWTQETGIFFGYRHAPDDIDQGSNFFVVKLKEINPICRAPSQLLVGTAYLAEERPTRGFWLRWLRQFPGKKGCQLLPPLRAADGWRDLHVRALDHRVTISVDGNEPIVLDLRGADKALVPDGGLDPRGALGIWATSGVGFFESGHIAALKSQEDSR